MQIIINKQDVHHNIVILTFWENGQFDNDISIGLKKYILLKACFRSLHDSRLKEACSQTEWGDPKFLNQQIKSLRIHTVNIMRE